MTRSSRHQVLKACFENFVKDDSIIKIKNNHGQEVEMSEAVMRLSSRYLNTMINDIKMVSKETEMIIIIPEVSLDVLDNIKNILLTGSSKSHKKIEEADLLQVQEIAILLGLDLVNLEIKDLAMKETDEKEEPLPLQNKIINVKKEPIEYFEMNEYQIPNISVKKELKIKKEKDDIKSTSSLHENLPEPTPAVTSSIIENLPEPTPAILPTSEETTTSAVMEEAFTEELLIETLPEDLVFETLPEPKSEGELNSSVELDNSLSGLKNFLQSSQKTPSPDKKRLFELADYSNSTYQEWKHKKYKAETCNERSKSSSHTPSKILPAPKSQIPEIQYIYEIFDHDLCGEKHRRIDDCRKGSRHNICGKKHSEFKNCDGSWLTLEQIEYVALHLESLKSKSVSSKRSHEERSINNKPPISDIPELQYIYKEKFHKLCGQVHSRLDLCDIAPVHAACGRKHGYAIECDGSWMPLAKFEALALRWPSTVAYKKLLASNTASPSQSTPRKRHRTRSRTLKQKLKSICFDWNLKGSCDESRGPCSSKHKCSYMEIDNKHGDRVCYRRHREREHSDWKKSISRYSRNSQDYNN